MSDASWWPFQQRARVESLAKQIWKGKGLLWVCGDLNLCQFMSDGTLISFKRLWQLKSHNLSAFS